MQKITSHHDGLGLNDKIKILGSDEDENGVAHKFEFFMSGEVSGESVEPDTQIGFLQFQKGPRSLETSTPGLTTDAVLASLIKIMYGFQSGPFPSYEGRRILDNLLDAFQVSKERAKNRASRGVLGKNQA